jgi:tetratricopeptide (TPR) repeat protein
MGDAVEACAAALTVDSERETALFLAAVVAAQRRPADLRGYAERLIAVNPWMWQYRQMLADALAGEGDWNKAAEACRQAIQLEPANVPCRQLLIRCCLKRGDKQRARAEFEACLPLLPTAEREGFRRSIEQQLR